MLPAECRAGRLLAAVRDVGHPCGYDGLLEAGWERGRPYFNAGLLLLDLQVGSGWEHQQVWRRTSVVCLLLYKAGNGRG